MFQKSDILFDVKTNCEENRGMYEHYDRNPEVLRKFISLDNNDEVNELKFRSLENNKLWFSAPSELNDPYECSAIIDRNILVDYLFSSEEIEKCYSLFANYGVLSLSAREIDYLPMWAYYTNNHQGFCVEYYVLNYEHIHKVMYQRERKSISKEIKLIRDYLRKTNESITTLQVRESVQSIMECLYIKDESWNHELEYRIVDSLTANRGCNIDISRCALKPIRIVAGINCKDKHKSRLNRISNKLGCGVLFEARKSDSSYGVILEKYASI